VCNACNYKSDYHNEFYLEMQEANRVGKKTELQILLEDHIYSHKPKEKPKLKVVK